MDVIRWVGYGLLVFLCLVLVMGALFDAMGLLDFGFGPK